MNTINNLIAVCKETTACICNELYHRQSGSLLLGECDNDVLNTGPIVLVELLQYTAFLLPQLPRISDGRFLQQPTFPDCCNSVVSLYM